MTSDLPPGDELAGVFVRASGLLLSAEAVNTALLLITSTAREVFPDAVGAGITLADRDGRRVTAAATDDVVARADALQYDLGEGPCLTAWKQRAVVRMDDVDREDRWPRWVGAVRGTGLCSALSTPVVAGAETLGAMKVYAAEPGVYGEREERLLENFATQAAVLLANTRTAEDARHVSDRLKDALQGREVIALAKGIIIARDGADERAAFLTLTDLAQHRGTSLREAAEDLVRSTVDRPI
ncbi:GAF and ANTAR domain-containing protein [Saccharothrix saharensis]|uniref:GAF and ANTAR domain-containing protein n=1 Tax=Saccharothrix saharensis TaxID=571190 RepID=UPI0036978DEE